MGGSVTGSGNEVDLDFSCRWMLVLNPRPVDDMRLVQNHGPDDLQGLASL